jgi:hypothetical protein
MINLIKYDWLRRWKFFLAGILVFVGVNWNIFNRISHGLGPNFITAILILFLCILSAALILDHIGRLYRTLFTDEGFTELARRSLSDQAKEELNRRMGQAMKEKTASDSQEKYRQKVEKWEAALP